MDLGSKKHHRTVHLVGSVPCETVEDVFKTICGAFPESLKRLPDGEIGERLLFVWFQKEAVFEAAGIKRALKAIPLGPAAEFTDSEVEEAEREIAEAKARFPVLDVKYDGHAISSYKVFVAQREAGVIPPDVKFQVAIPNPIAFVLPVVEARFHSQLYSYYRDSLQAAIRHIQSEIPHNDLSIQIDMPAEMILLHHGESMTKLVEQAREMIDVIKPDVDLGFHLCYGDINEKHSIEPPDTGMMTEFTRALLARIQRPVAFIHMPVPIDRDDEGYFVPLKGLIPQLTDGKTELYLGLVHKYDLEGTLRRMRVAANVLGTNDFGISTECGFGRKSPKDFENVLEVTKAAAAA